MDNPTDSSNLQQIGLQHAIMTRQILSGTRSLSSPTFASNVGGKLSRNNEETDPWTVTPRRAHKKRTSAEKRTPPAKQRIPSVLSSAKKSVKDMISMFETVTPTRAEVVPMLSIPKMRKTSPNPNSPSKAANKYESSFEPGDRLERLLNLQNAKVPLQQNEQLLSPPSTTIPSTPPPRRDISVSITPLSLPIPSVPPPSRAILHEFNLNIEHDDPDWTLTFQRHQDSLRMPSRKSVERDGVPDGPESKIRWTQGAMEIVAGARSAIEAENLQHVMEKWQNSERQSGGNENDAVMHISALGQQSALNTVHLISYDEIDTPMAPTIPESGPRDPNQIASFWASVRDALDISDNELGDYLSQMPEAVSPLENGFDRLVPRPEQPFSDLRKDGADVECSCSMYGTESAGSEPEIKISTLSPAPLRIKKVGEGRDGALPCDEQGYER
jgi:hypothetical protein